MNRRSILPVLVVPFAYFLKTRLRGGVQRVSWVFVYFVPVFIGYAIVASGNGIGLEAFLVAYILVNYVYENGYIQNDYCTIRKESNPTIRLTQEELAEIGQKKRSIIAIRLATIILLTTTVFLLSKDLGFFVINLFGCIILQLLYLLYNNIRNRLNLILVVPLSFLRFYLPIASIYVLIGEWLELAFLVLLYPMPKALEFTRQPRYKMQAIAKIVGDVDGFRPVYYAIVSVILIATFDFKPLESYSQFMCIYYTVYRAVSLGVRAMSPRIRNALKDHGKPEYRSGS